ncbi:MAG TPA: sigma 54-interacting transcriptional regulator [Planctomycetota bacterium]|nr:sigma 54-interacting transcriptional regulator [Planctomycetota bacterium]
MPDKIKLLVVEDTDADFRMVVEYLKESRLASFEITRSQTLSDTLKTLSKNKPDAVLADLGLPDSRGLTIVDSISKADPNIAIIVLTGLDDEKMGIAALNKGAQDYLDKGRLQGELLDKSIRYAIERKRAEEEVKRSEQKLRTIFEAVPCAILIMDDQLMVKTVNGASRQTFGIPETAIVNCRWCNALRCIHANETPNDGGFSENCKTCHVRNTALTALSGTETQRVTTSFEFFMDGQIQKRLLAISAASIEYEQKKMVVLTVDDITELSYLRQRLKIEHSFAGIVGKDEKMQELYGTIKELAESNAPVLIQGESGTGKELVASAIHNEGPRRNKQFVPVNCGALPDGLLESELFGHCKGSFTGAIRDKKGRFELAHGGTIFLDEVGDLSQAMQVKLLRVVQDGSFEPVGSEKTMKVDVRVISATNKDIQKEIKAGRFREDLFYRLCVVPITIPPLRERINDLPLLAKRFLEWSAKEYQKEKVTLLPEVLDILMSYHWTGNVRELQNVLQFALVKCRGNVIKPEHLPASISQANKHLSIRRHRKGKLDSRALEDALQKTHGNKVEAAKLLGVSRATIHRFLVEK